MTEHAAHDTAAAASTRGFLLTPVVAALLLGGAVLGSDTFVSTSSADDWAHHGASCGLMGDVYLLDEPGSYVAFVNAPSTTATVEVRGPHGEVLAAAPSTMVNAAAVDFATGMKFGLAPPPVFDVESNVLIHVVHDSPYELVLVRLVNRSEWSSVEVRPFVEKMPGKSGSCLIGDHPETMQIHTDAVRSDTTARQVFRVASPDPKR